MFDATAAERSEVPSDGTLCCLAHNVATKRNFPRKMTHELGSLLNRPSWSHIQLYADSDPLHVFSYPSSVVAHSSCAQPYLAPVKTYHGLVKPCRVSLGRCPAHVTPYSAPVKVYQAGKCPDVSVSQILPTLQSPPPRRGGQPRKQAKCSLC